MANPDQTITDSPRGEDGRFAPATPAPDASTTPAGAPSDGAATPGQQPAPAVDPYAAAIATLSGRAAAEPSAPGVGTDRTPTPPARTPPTPPGPKTPDAAETPSPSPEASKTTPADKAADAARDAASLAGYGDTMSKATFDLLKSVPGMLVAGDAWRAMDAAERVEHVQLVRDMRNDRMRQFNQQQRQRNAPPATHELPPQPGPTQARGAGEGQGQAPQTTPPTGQSATTDAGQLPAEEQAVLDALVEELGATHPLVRSQRTLMEQNLRLSRQLDQQVQAQQLQAIRQQQVADTRAFEDSVFSRLEAKYPQLKDPAVRDRLRPQCLDYFETATRKGRDLAADQAIEFVTHNSLYPETQQRQQQRSTENQQRSLDRTFDRGAPQAPREDIKPRATDPDGAYDEIAQGLSRAAEQGLTGEARRRSVLAGSR